jgi:TrmH family RNA methyltransferase
MEKITSKNNSIIKDTKKLFTSSKARRDNSLFALEGARLCFDVLNSFYKVKTLLVSERVIQKYSDKVQALENMADESYIITEELAQKLSQTSTPQGIFVICKMQENKNEISNGKYVILDNVQDPSNVGAIIRTAEALGITGIITYNCCDVYNSKALRASMGSILRMSIIDVENLHNTIYEMQNNDFMIYSTVPLNDAQNIKDIDFKRNVACVIGNEANGVEQSILDISNGLITIPMLGRAESLNASVAGSITMWEMMR